MKLARLVDPNFHSALTKLSTQNLPVRVAFKLKGIVKTTNEEYAKYEEIRNELLNKFGKKNEDGSLCTGEHNSVQFEGDNYMLFAKELGELVSVELDIPTIKVSELGENITLNVLEIEQLEGLIVE